MMQVQFEQILNTNGLIAPGQKVLVAVSGGADSMALLHLLLQAAPANRFSLVAAHLDHQLRPESHLDTEFVADFCARHQVPFVSGAEDISALARKTGVGLEEAGRNARQLFLRRVADDQGCDVIALAHHADDQAETLLFRMMRGSGLSGLAGMRLQNGCYIRPLLSFRSAELKRYLTEEAIAWREDETNTSPEFTRNRIRHQLLPQLSEYNPKIVSALCRLSRQAADEDEYWADFSRTFLDQYGRQAVDGFEVDIAALKLHGRGSRRRLLRAFLRQTQGSLASIDAVHIDQIDDLLVADRPQAELSLPGIWVARRYGRLLCSRSAPRHIEYELSISGPGEIELPNGDRLTVSVGRFDESTDSPDAAYFSAAAIIFPLTVRSLRPGDRFRPSGMQGRKLLKDFFIDAKIDRESRLRTPVVCYGEEVIWLAGQRRCEGFRPSPGDNQLKITLFRSGCVAE